MKRLLALFAALCAFFAFLPFPRAAGLPPRPAELTAAHLAGREFRVAAGWGGTVAFGRGGRYLHRAGPESIYRGDWRVEAGVLVLEEHYESPPLTVVYRLRLAPDPLGWWSRREWRGTYCRGESAVCGGAACEVALCSPRSVE